MNTAQASGLIQPSPAFTNEIEPMVSLTASRDVAVVRKAIREKYGIIVHDRFAQDLIDFVHALTDGQQ